MKISLEKKKVNNMKYADLHIHSSYSDGVKSPEEIIARKADTPERGC